MCANETEQQRCSQVIPISYPVFDRNTKGKNTDQVHQYVCGQKPGVVQQCCDPFDPASQELVQDGQLVRIIHDLKGQPVEYLVCTCGNNPACQKQFCSDFKIPTQYEKCRARGLRPGDQKSISPHVYQVKASNAYPNCYRLCQGGTL